MNKICSPLVYFENHNLEIELVRIDEITGKRYTFIADPDGLPIEFCEK